MVGEEKRKVTNNHLLVTFFAIPVQSSLKGLRPLKHPHVGFTSSNDLEIKYDVIIFVKIWIITFLRRFIC